MDYSMGSEFEASLPLPSGTLLTESPGMGASLMVTAAQAVLHVNTREPVLIEGRACCSHAAGQWLGHPDKQT